MGLCLLEFNQVSVDMNSFLLFFFLVSARYIFFFFFFFFFTFANEISGNRKGAT
ncbi:hypothetical protein QG37_03073 [Candidozyma auris]|uniref:Uncharacterized protein n=1 Tax=Candidozyma auris TaxID=498019 RepID=A0A0L0P1J2_CANAR|nr:hypothetical protein QG37_03073 [[Candida] auris]